MAYVDLNPVRAKIASNIATSRYTSVKMRNHQLRENQPLMPLVGARSFNLPGISEADYIELVDFTGRELHPDKRGKIEASEPETLTKLGCPQSSFLLIGVSIYFLHVTGIVKFDDQKSRYIKFT